MAREPRNYTLFDVFKNGKHFEVIMLPFYPSEKQALQSLLRSKAERYQPKMNITVKEKRS